MKVISALSPTSGLLATHAGSLSSNGGKTRLVVRCYDSKVSLGTLKFTLIAKVSSKNNDDNDEDTATPDDKPEISQLLFCGAQDNFLIATLPKTNECIVWDLKRGVVSHTLPTPTNSVLCGAVSSLQNEAHHLHVLVKNRESSKLVVCVYDLNTEKGKCFKKVKFGSCAEDEDVFGIAIDEENEMMAVRYGKRIKILPRDGKNGIKMKVKGESATSNVNGDARPVVPLTFSKNGECIATVQSNRLLIFNSSDGKQVGTGSLSSTDDDTQNNCHLQFYGVDEPLVLVMEESNNKGSLFQFPAKDNMKPLATISSPENAENGKVVNRAFFTSGERGRSKLVVMESAPRGIGDMDIHLSELEYRNVNDDDQGTGSNGSLLTGELYPNQDDSDKADDSNDGSKKRKAPSAPKSSLILGPGEGGDEAMKVSDQIKQKKQKKNDGDDKEDEFGLDEDLGEEGGTTVAERLTLLSSELDRDTDEDEELITGKKGRSAKDKINFKVKGCTTASLLTLLRQALASNDDSQLEIALMVTDQKVIENSIVSLFEESIEGEMHLILALLSKLTTRLSRKANRANSLSFWVSTILVTLLSHSNGTEGALSMGKVQKEVASNLGPLRNLLNERVESLPQLLKLEGRLSLLGKQL